MKPLIRSQSWSARALALIGFAYCLAGCGSDSDASTATLMTTLDFSASQGLPDSATQYVVQVLDLDGGLMDSESGTRTPGSGSLTLTFTGLAPGSAVARAVLSAESDQPVGIENILVKLTAGKDSSITFANPTLVPPSNAPAAPIVTSVSPDNGTRNLENVVRIFGSGFTGATFVVFGATYASYFAVMSDTVIVAITPQISTARDWLVTVTTPAGTSTQVVIYKFY